MPTDRTPLPDLDARTADLGRRWFAEVRQREQDEKAVEQRQAERRVEPAGSSDLIEWLFAGDGDANGDGGSD